MDFNIPWDIEHNEISTAPSAISFAYFDDFSSGMWYVYKFERGWEVGGSGGEGR